MDDENRNEMNEDISSAPATETQEADQRNEQIELLRGIMAVQARTVEILDEIKTRIPQPSPSMSETLPAKSQNTQSEPATQSQQQPPPVKQPTRREKRRRSFWSKK